MNINAVKHVGGKAVLLAKKFSPEILTGVGVTSIVAGTVIACKQTLKVDEVMDKYEVTKEVIERAKDGVIDPDNFEDGQYTEEDYKKDTIVNKVTTGKEIVKLYIPAATMLILGITCVLGAQGIMKKRNAALLATYKLCQDSFNNYRNRVKEELGDDKDFQFYHGIEKETITNKVKDEDGKKKTVKEEQLVAPSNLPSQYSRYFDEANPNWSKSPEQNKYFLTRVQSMLNDQLHANGYIFLNEVYEALGFERTSAGQLVGWVYDDDDCVVDFMIYDKNNLVKRDFVNCNEPSILLDFNVDGVIYDLI